MGKFHLFLIELSALNISDFFSFQTIPRVDVNGFSPNLMCALILWRPGFGLLMSKFHQFFSYLPVTHQYFCFWTIT